MTLSVGELFAGIAGFGLGMERAGLTCKWQVEIDNACQSVLRRHFPDARRVEDVRTANDLEYVDVLCAGWPCQDHSIAGLRGGLAGNRSGLFWEMIRVIKYVRPRFVLWENVLGLRSSDDGRDFPRVLRGLADAGYFGAVRGLDARWFGVPQRRQRVFGLFARNDTGTEWRRACEILAVKESLHRHPAEGKKKKQGVAACLTSGTANGSGVSRSGRRREDDVNLVHTLRAAGADASEDGTGRGTPLIAASLNRAPFQDRGDDVNLIPTTASTLGGGSGRRGWCDDADRATFIPTLSIGSHPGGFNGQDVLQLIPTLNASDGGVSSGMQPVIVASTLNCMSGIQNPDVMNYVVQDQAFTITSRDKKGVNGNANPGNLVMEFQSSQSGVRTGEVHATLDSNNGSRRHNGIVGKSGVRRLTPLETERCQGFPDNYTKWGDNGNEISDSRRYSMIGNSVVPAIAEWIGRRIISSMKTS